MWSENLDGHEVCAVCGKDADGGHWFCHFYQENGTRVTLCSPKCADVYLHRADVPHLDGSQSPWASAEVARVGS